MAMYVAPGRVTFHDRSVMNSRMLSRVRCVTFRHSPGARRIDCGMGQTDDSAEAEKDCEGKCFFHDFLEVGACSFFGQESPTPQPCCAMTGVKNKERGLHLTLPDGSSWLDDGNRQRPIALRRCFTSSKPCGVKFRACRQALTVPQHMHRLRSYPGATLHCGSDANTIKQSTDHAGGKAVTGADRLRRRSQRRARQSCAEPDMAATAGYGFHQLPEATIRLSNCNSLS
jgi:hypothetical protein